MKKYLYILVGLVVVLSLALAACQPAATTAPTTVTAKPTTVTATATTTAVSTVTATATVAPPISVPANAEEFYKANGITLVVNGSVGGGTDYAGRAFASYWSEATGGPGMMLQTKSGGGGLEGLNYVHGAKPDGLTIGMTTFASDIATPRLLGLPGITWDAKTLGWIGMFGDTPHVIMIKPDATYKTVADLQAAPKLRWSATNPGSSVGPSAVFALIIMGLDKNSQMTWGFETVEQGLAMKRDEVDIYAASAQNALDDIDKGFSKMFCTLTTNQSAWAKPKEVPPITKLMTLNADQKDMLTFVEALGTGKVLYTPPGVDAGKLAYLRANFDKVMKNEGFLKIIKVRFPIWDPPTDYKGVIALQDQVLNWDASKLKLLSDTVKAWVK